MTGRPRPAVVALPAYRPGKSAAAAEAEHGIVDAIKLASNELPYAPLPSVVAAIRDAAGTAQIYADHRATELRAAIATSLGIAPDRVTVGAGSVGLLQQLALTFVDAGDGVAFCWPSFEAYPVFSGLVDARQVRPALRRQTFDLDALADWIDEQTKVVFIANPNNPTGTVVGTQALVDFIERVPPTCLVVVDEAYAEFVTDPRITDSIAVLDRFPNVVMLRTFSKAHGMAALRIGYAVGHPDVIGMVDRTLVPFVVNGIGQQAALASLGALDEMHERVASVVAGRTTVSGTLRRAGWSVPESQANFVWLPAGRASADLGVSLERLGVVTRVFPDVGIRVTIGDASANERFLDAFAKATVELDAEAWELPTGELAIRVAAELDALDDALARLSVHAAATPSTGLTDADPPTGEQWDEGQIWAHLAEFGSYWLGELRTIVDSPETDPVSFGRTKRDPHRIAMIEQHRDSPPPIQFTTVQQDIAAFRADLAELTAADWQRRGVHETLGEMDLWTFLRHFVTGHYVEHANQLDSIRGRPAHG